MSKDGDIQHVIMQLEHERKKKIAVRLDWLLNSDKVREKLKCKQKHQEAIFFFYHHDPSTTPSFSLSLYSKEFDPQKAACYKGHISNTIYDSLIAAETALKTKRIPMAAKTKGNVASEAELEAQTKTIRRKENKQIKGLQKSAKNSNSAYVVDAFKKLNRKPLSPLNKVPAEGVVQQPLPVNPTESIPVATSLLNEISAEGVVQQQFPVNPTESIPVKKLNKVATSLLNEISAEGVVQQPLPVNPTESIPVATSLLNEISAEDVVQQQFPVNPTKSIPVKKLKKVATSLLNEISAEDVVQQPLPVNPTESIPVATSLLNEISAEGVVQQQFPVNPTESIPVKKLNKVATSSLNEGVVQQPFLVDRKSSSKKSKKKVVEYCDSDSDLESEDDSLVTRSGASYSESKEVVALRRRLERKTKIISAMKTKYEKLERNSDIWRELNFQWQRDHHACTCKAERMKDSPTTVESKDLFTITQAQQLSLAVHMLPGDQNKYAVEMATYLFTEQELKSTTAAKLDKVKIAFISKYMQEKAQNYMSEPQIKDALNKFRLNKGRIGTSNRKQSKVAKRLHNDDDEHDEEYGKRSKNDDDVDLNGFLLLAMSSNEEVSVNPQQAEL